MIYWYLPSSASKICYCNNVYKQGRTLVKIRQAAVTVLEKIFDKEVILMFNVTAGKMDA